MLWEPIPCLEIEIPFMECQVLQLQHQVPFWDILILYTECQLPCLGDQVPRLRQPTPMTETPDLMSAVPGSTLIKPHSILED